MWNVETLEFAVKIAALRTSRSNDTIKTFKGKDESLEYSSVNWAWELLGKFIENNRHLSAGSILERFMIQMEEWQIEATHDDARVAFLVAHDLAELLYDTMVGG